MSIRRASARTSVNSGSSAAAAATPNIITIAPATATTVAGGGTIGSGASAPTITQISVTDSSYNTLDDTAVQPDGGYLKITGTGFQVGGVVYVGGIAATVTTFVSATELRAEIGSASSNTFHVYVVNPDGSGAIRLTGITYSSAPTWITSSTLDSQTVDNPFSINLVATADSTISYQVSPSSSLPPNVTLLSSGTLAGNVAGLQNNTTYSFTIDAVDLENQNTLRTFSLTITTGDLFFANVTALIKSTSVNDVDNRTYIDSSPNQFQITLAPTTIANVAQGSVGPFAVADGIDYDSSVNGASAYFDGSGDFLIVNNSENLQLDTGPFTIESWIYNTSITAVNHVAGKGAATTGWAIGLFANSSPFVSLGSVSYPVSDVTVSGNTWTHIAATRTASNDVHLYINGQQSSVLVNSTLDLNQTTVLTIGAGRANVTPFNGYISDFRIVKGQAVYTDSFTPPTVPLTAIENTQLLLNFSNAQIFDAKANHNVETIGAVTSTTQTKVNATSIYLASGARYARAVPKTGDTNFGTGDFTIDYWVYTEATVANAANFNISNINNPSTAYGILVRAGVSNWVLFIGDPATSTWVTNSVNVGSYSTYPTLNTWQHHALTRESGTIRFFIDGTQTYTGTNTTNLTQRFLFLGVYASLYLNGFLEDFRITKGVARYTADFTPPTQPVLAR